MVCVPIRIEAAVCGVLELVNKIGPGGFREKDRRLLEIFADYASISIQNLLDARRAFEVAKRDGLTGLYNERYLHLRLTQELSRISRDGGDLSVIFLDLDNLKSVNDRHGHLAGSQVLREVGYLLRRTVTDDRATLTRYGGDEFVLILPGYDMQEGMEIAQSIRNAIRASTFLSRPYGFNDPALNLHGVLTASLGVSSIRSHTTRGGSVEQHKNELLRAADAALYRAKQLGKDRCVGAREEDTQVPAAMLVSRYQRISLRYPKMIRFAGRRLLTPRSPMTTTASSSCLPRTSSTSSPATSSWTATTSSWTSSAAAAPTCTTRAATGCCSTSTRTSRRIPVGLQPPEDGGSRVPRAPAAGGPREADQQRHLHDALRRVRRDVLAPRDSADPLPATSSSWKAGRSPSRTR